MSKTLWIIAGPNGSGKSTLVRRHNTLGLPVSNPDDIAALLSPQAPEAAALEAGREAVRQRERLFQEGKSFLVETTFSGASPLNLIDKAHACGYKVSLVFVAVQDPLLSILRVDSRVRSGGHFVPKKDILRRYERSFDNFKMTLSDIDRAYLIDNSPERPSIVAHFQKGKIQRLSRNPPQWLIRRIPEIG